VFVEEWKRVGGMASLEDKVKNVRLVKWWQCMGKVHKVIGRLVGS